MTELNDIMKSFLLLLLAISFNLDVSAQESKAETEQACYLPTQSNVAYSAIAELPVGSPNEVLAYGDGPFQFGELWLPTSSTDTDASNEPVRRHPLVVLVHGGCWLNSFDIRHTHALSTALAQAGYAVWSVEYRRTGDQGGGWPGSFDDIKAAIEYLPELSEYPVKTNRVALAGHSAGGHLALLAGADRLYDFSAVIGLAAIVDLEKYSQGENSCQLATPKFMGGTPAGFPKRYNEANPATLNLHESTILLHGSLDSIVPVAHAQTSTASRRIIEGGGHFDMIHPGTASYQILLQELAKAFAEKG